MAVFIKGGFKKIEYNTEDVWTGAQTEIPNLKEVVFTPTPFTDEFADGTEGYAGESYQLLIRSTDMSGAWIAALETLSEAQTPVFFRVTPSASATPNLVLESMRVGNPYPAGAEAGQSATMNVVANVFGVDSADILSLNLPT